LGFLKEGKVERENHGKTKNELGSIIAYSMQMEVAPNVGSERSRDQGRRKSWSSTEGNIFKNKMSNLALWASPGPPLLTD
jgi:uncharacterized protein involved in copper resistance